MEKTADSSGGGMISRGKLPRENDGVEDYPLISVIVPFHNAAKDLKEAVDSVTAQDYPNLEIILVDDCSSDGSPAIAEELREKDNRIRILTHVENQGVGPARNDGVANASGGYLIFLDSDDYFKPNALSLLWRTAVREDSPVVIGSCDQIDERGIISDHDRISDSGLEGSFGLVCGEEIVRRWLRIEGKFIPVRPWGVLIESGLYRDSGLDFRPGEHEDLSFTPFLFKYAGKVIYLEDIIATYRIRKGSILNSPQTVDRINRYRAVWDDTEARLERFGLSGYTAEFRRFHLQHLFFLLERNECGREVLDAAASLIRDKLNLKGTEGTTWESRKLQYFLEKSARIMQKAGSKPSFRFWESSASIFDNRILHGFIIRNINSLRKQIWRIPMSDEIGREDLLHIKEKLSEEDLSSRGQAEEIAALREENEHLRKKLVEISYYLNMALSDMERRVAVSTGEGGPGLGGVIERFNPSSLLARLGRLPGFRAFRESRIIRTIRESGQFSPDFYRETYTDLADYQGDLLLHFVRYGGFEGRSPNRYFDSKWYLNANPAVRIKGVNPLYHYLKVGAGEGLWPSPDYNPEEYDDLISPEKNRG